MPECLYCHVPVGEKHQIDCPQFEPTEDFKTDGGTAGAEYDQPELLPQAAPLCHAIDCAEATIKSTDEDGYTVSTYRQGDTVSGGVSYAWLKMPWTEATRNVIRPGMKVRVQIRVIVES